MVIQKNRLKRFTQGVGEVEGVNARLTTKEDNIADDEWNELERKSNAIIFGSPTYMGGPALHGNLKNLPSMLHLNLG